MHTPEPPCSAPFRSSSRGNSAGTDWSCCCCPLEAFGFRGAIDSCEHSLTSLLDLPEQRIDVPPDEFALPEHDLSRDQHVANVPWIHHRHNRARYIVYRPGINAPRVEHDDVGFFAGHESTDLVEQPSGRRTGDGGHLDDLP